MKTLRIPQNVPPEIQAALRQVGRRLENLESTTVDMQGRRLGNAGDARKPQEYVTLRQIQSDSIVSSLLRKIASSRSASGVSALDAGSFLERIGTTIRPRLITDLLGLAGSNGSGISLGSASEEITLSLVGATTDSTANLLPKDSLILAAPAYVTTTISGGGSTSWNHGNATTVNLFSNTVALTAGTTDQGLRQWRTSTNAATLGPYNNAAVPVRITVNGGTPTQGKVRIVVFYLQVTVPTS